jgi:hypothetical protein
MAYPDTKLEGLDIKDFCFMFNPSCVRTHLYPCLDTTVLRVIQFSIYTRLLVSIM